MCTQWHSSPRFAFGIYHWEGADHKRLPNICLGRGALTESSGDLKCGGMGGTSAKPAIAWSPQVTVEVALALFT